MFIFSSLLVEIGESLDFQQSCLRAIMCLRK